ncbi:ABC transporter ATP-binding protein [Tenacibaculum sp. ZS6-P6]|uniref:ABC transporter ATP-binding protein n=1 Tax=Tenacibaculum sp. ZS6-P6 TaxID=3447503 RepID=UPI003F9C2E1A
MLQVIKTENLTFSYTRKGNDIKNLNLNIFKGSIYGFLGPNGSGKSTTIRLILGLLKKDSGNVELFGKSFNSKTRIEILEKIGVLIENPSLYNHLSGIDNLKIAANYRENISSNRIDEVLELVKLNHAKTKKVKTYSLGMKQRLGLAITLLSKPELIILDEPTNGLDPKGIIEMRELIKDLNQNYGTTFFISSHLLSEIEKTCTHVGIIRNGEMLFQDTIASFKNSTNDKIILEIEVDNLNQAKIILSEKSFNFKINNENLCINLDSKKEIPNLLDILRNENIEVYQSQIKNNLEDFFLSLTENKINEIN